MISILIIGNEILSHQIEDRNLKRMLESLNAASYPIDEVRIVRDGVEIIGDAVRALSSQSDIVISSGGVGPTHDDVTFEAYSYAFDSPLVLNEDLKTRMQRWFGEGDLKESMLRMARIPACSELVELGPKSWPLIKVKNCYVLPGLPEVFNKKFDAMLELLPAVAPRLAAELSTSHDETVFAEALTVIDNTFPSVEVGSYPTYDRSDYAARVTLKSTDEVAINQAFEALYKLFEDLDSLVTYKTPTRI